MARPCCPSSQTCYRANRRSPASSFEAVGDGAMLEPPFADEGLAAGLDLLARLRVDHVIVVGLDLFVQPLRRMRQQVPGLVNLMPRSA